MPARDYDAIARSLVGLQGSVTDRMQRVCDALWDRLHLAGVSWLGFYRDQPGEPDDRRLILGPHRDKPACSPIGLHGVCGRALTTGSSQIVDDVATLGPNYVACDPRDRSELVIPLHAAAGRVWAVLDLDSWDLASFSPADDAGLRAVIESAGLTRIAAD